MLDRFKVAFAASRAELAALVGATLAISLSGYKMLENSPIASDCFPWSDKCFAAIGATSTGFKVVSGIIIFCAISLIWLNYKKFRDGWRKAEIEPVGFFFDRVSQPENTKETIEYSLVEVRRNGTGGLEYRGVGRRPHSQRPLEYRWRAREAVVRSSGDDVHKLFFRVRPGDIKFYSPRQRQDGTQLADTIVYNLGCIEYGMSEGKPEKLTGIFFDYTLAGDYLGRGKIELSPAEGKIRGDATKIFQRYFASPELPEHQMKVIELIDKLEGHFNR
jgi:hypothetical protein